MPAVGDTRTYDFRGDPVSGTPLAESFRGAKAGANQWEEGKYTPRDSNPEPTD